MDSEPAPKYDKIRPMTKITPNLTADGINAQERSARMERVRALQQERIKLEESAAFQKQVDAHARRIVDSLSLYYGQMSEIQIFPPITFGSKEREF
ncbi:MAG: hypothetical protein UT00_C0016G0009 [Parcubacteria group bacterium GW2011_GWA1_38_7]|nr:MAG: hypothetical protein UT00_C0016G0009 [Parcubacteria group bacterium GW2011_GWA1_38_7]